MQRNNFFEEKKLIILKSLHLREHIKCIIFETKGRRREKDSEVKQ